MSFRKIVMLVVLSCMCFCPAYADTNPDQIISDAISVVKEMSSQKDADSMGETLRGSYAIAVVPSMVKAGILLGGEYGEGLVLRREGGKWYGPSFYNLGGASFGLQLGAQKVSLLLAVINERGVNAFIKNKTKLGGEIGVAAGPVGRRAEAATDAKATASIYSYSMAKGLFAGISLDGSVISISVKRNQEYWGGSISAEEALKKPANDKRIKPLLKALDELIAKSK
ncbi:MAG: lipid-binding SYLF domain-containing protein [Synergistaceae bacterium]|nr:lipid-binding SYLF domain-containing protein [Synergistaceae bacterium]